MKISILTTLKQGPFGGGNQFLKALRKCFIKKGIYEANPEKAHALLFNSFPFREEHRFWQAYNLKKMNKILIHRVDGPIYKIRNKDYKVDKIIYKFNELLADGTIFQSKWSKFENYQLGMKKNKYEIVIFNAPDSDIFNRKEKMELVKNKKIKLIATSWSSNWNKGFHIYKYLDEKLDFSKYDMTFIGNSPIRFNNIIWIKPLKSEDLAMQLKQHDIFIIASQNDPCSNSLIEALHCGLPVIVLNDGGHPEIMGKNGITFNGKKDVLDKIDELVQNIDKFKVNLKLWNIEEVANQYHKFIKKIYDDYDHNDYSPKKIRKYHFIKLRFHILRWKIMNNGLFNFLIQSLIRTFKNIVQKILSLSDSDMEIKCLYRNLKIEQENNINWIFNLKTEIPNFLKNLKGTKRRGFYNYSLSGDFFGERIKWGLGNAVFFLKIIYTLNLEKDYKEEVIDTINYIRSFQRKDGSFYDPFIRVVSFTLRAFYALKFLDFSYFRYKEIKRAETRQALSTLSLFNVKPYFKYKKIPKNEKTINNYLKKLNWEMPWGAGSHYSHLLFFLHHSNLINKNKLIDYAIKWVNKLQHKEDGFWYEGNPSIQQKINGAMKIISGLKAVNKVNFKFAKKIIDGILLAKNDSQACDNFNIIYILKYCNELTKSNYRYFEIKDFTHERLKIYREYYFQKIGGFSFHKNQANMIYYGAFISRGKNEPDIHGTILFLWGLSIIAQILNLNYILKFKEHIT